MNKRSLTNNTPSFPSRLLAVVAMALILFSCERRPLEVYYEDLVRIKVELDWMDHFGMRPNGMLMLVYDDQDSLYTSRQVNEVDEQRLNLGVGTYKFIFVSYPDQETTYFLRLGNHYYANERSVVLGGHTYDYWEKDRYREAPEPIGAAVDTIVITIEMVDQHINGSSDKCIGDQQINEP